MQRARLSRYGLLSVTGADARAFLHAQLTNDIEQLSQERWALAGWCSAKGRLLASFLVIPAPDGFLLQVARDLAAPVAKRLSMFVLRSKAKISDLSDAWAQFGVWDTDLASGEVSWRGNVATVRVGERRFLQLGPSAELTEPAPGANEADEVQWTLQEIRAGRCEQDVNLVCKVYEHRDTNPPHQHRFDWLASTGERPRVPAWLDLHVVIALVRVPAERFRVRRKISACRFRHIIAT